MLNKKYMIKKLKMSNSAYTCTTYKRTQICDIATLWHHDNVIRTKVISNLVIDEAVQCLHE